MSEAVISFPWISLEVNPNKVWFSIFGKPIYWYGVLIGVGFLLAVFYVMRRAKHFGLSEDHLIDMLIYAVPAAIVGARLYYVLFEWPIYAANPVSIFWIWKGGLAIYGGIIGGVSAAAVYCRIKKFPVGAMLDLGSMGLLIGQSIGRWGNFFNREAFGNRTDVLWKMGLTQPGRQTVYYHPAFLYEFLWNVIGFIFLHIFSKKNRKYDGQMFLMYIAWYGLGRFLIEGLRTDSLYLGGTSIRVSQLLAGISCLTCVTLLVVNHLREHKPIYAGIIDENSVGDAEKADTNETAEGSIDENSTNESEKSSENNTEENNDGKEMD